MYLKKIGVNKGKIAKNKAILAQASDGHGKLTSRVQNPHRAIVYLFCSHKVCKRYVLTRKYGMYWVCFFQKRNVSKTCHPAFIYMVDSG